MLIWCWFMGFSLLITYVFKDSNLYIVFTTPIRVVSVECFPKTSRLLSEWYWIEYPNNRARSAQGESFSKNHCEIIPSIVCIHIAIWYFITFERCVCTFLQSEFEKTNNEEIRIAFGSKKNGAWFNTRTHGFSHLIIAQQEDTSDDATLINSSKIEQIEWTANRV